MNFNKPYKRENFQGFAKGFLPDGFTPRQEQIQDGRSFEYTKEIHELGSVPSLEGLAVLEITHESEHDPRVSVTREAFKILKRTGDKHALVAFRSKKTDNYRISYIKMWPKIEEGQLKKEKSNPRRYSFYLGPDAKVNTPREFLEEKGKVSSVKDLESRFDVEVVNKEFYSEIAELFSDLVGEENNYSLRLPSKENDGEIAQQFTVRLIGRIIFCWFLREKESKSGKPLVPDEVLSLQSIKENDDYYHKALEPLFFEILNKPKEKRQDKFKDKPFAQIPYLNGGLFTPQENDFYREGEYQSEYRNTLKVPDGWLEELFELLDLYNFTIDENTSFDVDLSIDPEMLGRIFENLLAEKINPETKENARKNTGSFYTPREIVGYMVDESLTEHLKAKTNISEDKIRALVSYDLTDDEDYPLTDEEKKKVVDVLSEITILDPACGSGAFPIGALQKIVFMLQQVDPNAERWFERQIDEVPPETKSKIKREFKEQNHDYIRKTAVIRQSIYGVDIQPVATEIARLRCFLTLIVDERIEDDRKNRGVEPLPNLEFKFVTANTLKKLPEEDSGQKDLFGDQDGMKKLSQLREEYFAASNARRESLKDEITSVQKDMLLRLHEVGAKKSDRTVALSGWEPFNNKKTEWFDPEWMFGIDGFDVVIGNPPYISTEKIDDPEKTSYRETYRDVHKSRTDVYAYFYQRGVELTKEGSGLLCYITSNKWMRAGYGEGLREYFANKNPLQLVDFGGVKVFDSATVDTAILLVGNSEGKKELTACKIDDDYEKTADLKRYIQDNSITMVSVSSETWFIAPPEVVYLKEKIEKVGTPLKDWSLKINLGIKTGCNEAFIIDESKRNELVAKDENSKKIIEPLIESRNIKRYKAEHNDSYLIHTHNGYSGKQEDRSPVDIEKYPAIKEHLDKHWDQIKDRGDQGKAPYNLRDCAYVESFSKEKIVWPDIAREPRFSILQAGYYFKNTAYMIVGDNLYYLLGVLNSKVIEFSFDLIASGLGGKNKRYFKSFVKELPVPHYKVNLDKSKKISNLAMKITNKKQDGKETNDLENKIDELVMDLYKLTEEEKEIIRNS